MNSREDMIREYEETWGRVKVLESDNILLQDECKYLKTRIKKLESYYLILLILLIFTHLGLCNYFIDKIKDLKQQNQIYEAQIKDLTNKFPDWYTEAYNKCTSDQVPTEFIKPCIAYELGGY